MPNFSDEEKALLAPYVTNVDGTIYAVKGPVGMIGAIMARYSRAPGGFRQTLLKEFVKEGVLDPAKADAIIQRVLIQYGDDSVGALEGAHMAFEDISILSTKELEDRRIGGAPIEQSTRYSFYDMPGDDGLPRYFRPIDVMASPHASAYVETMEFVFTTYRSLIEPMKAYYSGLKPIQTAEYDIDGDGRKEKWDTLTGEAERKAFRTTWNADIRTKSCDTLRALLPIATKTNVGIYGNGQFFQHVLTHCYTHPLPEVQDIARRGHAELDKVIPNYVKRAKVNDYVADNRERMRRLAPKIFAAASERMELMARMDHYEMEARHRQGAGLDVRLLDHGEEFIMRVVGRPGFQLHHLSQLLQDEADHLTIALMLYPWLTRSLEDIRTMVRFLPTETKHEIIMAYLGDRGTRRDRPGRALEGGYPYTFDLCTDFGTYKDLERHRMMTQDRQAFTPMLGFQMPDDLKQLPPECLALSEECVRRAQALYTRLAPDFPDAASYATLHGSLVRWTMGINDRALMHMLELRTQPAGHPSYRKVCKLMHEWVSSRCPWRGEAMKFVDHGDYFWARGDSEARQRAKEAELEKKAP